MPNLTFRNRLGELVDVPSVPATRLKNELGSVLERAAREGAVAITRHDTPRAVLLSYDEFLSLAQSRSRSMDDLNAQFDGLLESMQTDAMKKGMRAAFDASPAELGRAALKAARGAAVKPAPGRAAGVKVVSRRVRTR